MLTIALNRIEFDGRHGATAVERRPTRKFEVDVELEVEAAVAERSDLLADTVDYSRVAEIIVGVGMGEPHHLLESLARRMLDGVSDEVSAGRGRCGSSCASSTRPPARVTPPIAAVRMVRRRRSPSVAERSRQRGARRAARSLHLGVEALVAVADADRRADGDADVKHGQRDAAPVGQAAALVTRPAFGLASLSSASRGAASCGPATSRPHQPPVDVAAVADAHDRLLAEVTALAVVDRAVEADLHREVVGGDLGAEARFERGDARRLGRGGLELGHARGGQALRASLASTAAGPPARSRRCRARARARSTGSPRRPSTSACASGGAVAERDRRRRSPAGAPRRPGRAATRTRSRPAARRRSRP